MERKFDPILVQVVKNELASVNEEMAIAVYRTGRSAMVKVGDFATAVCDALCGSTPMITVMDTSESLVRDRGGHSYFQFCRARSSFEPHRGETLTGRSSFSSQPATTTPAAGTS